MPASAMPIRNRTGSSIVIVVTSAAAILQLACRPRRIGGAVIGAAGPSEAVSRAGAGRAEDGAPRVEAETAPARLEIMPREQLPRRSASERGKKLDDQTECARCFEPLAVAARKRAAGWPAHAAAGTERTRRG